MAEILRTDVEKLIAEARANLAHFERVEDACAKQLAELQQSKIAAQRVKGKTKAKARAMKEIARAESALAAGAKVASAARVSTAAALQELQAELERLNGEAS